MSSVQIRQEAHKALINMSKVLRLQPTQLVERLIRDKRDELISQKKLKDDRW